MTSLRTRLLIGSGLVVLIFVVTIAGVVRAARVQQHELALRNFFAQRYLVPLAQAAQVAADGLRVSSARLPEPFATPGSGVYAQWRDANGRAVWRTPSSCPPGAVAARLLTAEVDTPLRLDWRVFADCVPGANVAFPPPLTATGDQIRLGMLTSADGTALYAASQSRVLSAEPYTLQVTLRADHAALRPLTRRLQTNQRLLLRWLLGGALALLVILAAVSLWLLRPMWRVGREVKAIQAGRQPEITGVYAPELRPLTENLNTLMRQNRARLKRYRARLDELAHSFKTPLAVQKAAAENEKSADRLRRVVLEQVERMLQEVNFHLKRAATYGQLTLAKTVAVKPVAEKNLNAFKLLYQPRGIRLTLQADERLRFSGYEGDLLEILGNLTENACKAARGRVRIKAYAAATAEMRDRCLILEVEDDGPGIAPGEREAVFRRGRRGDAYSDGSGLGLALVKDIVEEGYGGRVEIGDSALGGACVRVSLLHPSDMAR